MRRKDREMGKEFGVNVTDKSRYGILSMIDADKISYGVPVSIVRDKNTLYFHSAKEGRKASILKRSPNVSVVFVGDVKVPENFTKEELDEFAQDESKAAVFISSVFTTEYESAIVTGKVVLVDDEGEKVNAMRLICDKYASSKMGYFDIAIKAGLNKVDVYKIEIENITAKRKKYDRNGVEMKYGRME